MTWLPHHDLFPWPPVVNSVHLSARCCSVRLHAVGVCSIGDRWSRAAVHLSLLLISDLAAAAVYCCSDSDIVCAPVVSMILPTAVSLLMQCWVDIIWRLLKLAPSWTLTPECECGTRCDGAQEALLILFIPRHGTVAPGSPPGTKHELQLRIRG